MTISNENTNTKKPRQELLLKKTLTTSFDVSLLGFICVDRSEFCNEWRKDGRCKTDAWVQNNCLVECKRSDICDITPYLPTGNQRCYKSTTTKLRKKPMNGLN